MQDRSAAAPVLDMALSALIVPVLLAAAFAGSDEALPSASRLVPTAAAAWSGIAVAFGALRGRGVRTILATASADGAGAAIGALLFLALS